MTRRTVWAALLATCALVAFSGCAVVGTVQVRSADQVAIDLTVTGNESYLPLCEATGWPAEVKLAFEEQLNEVGEKTCRVTGVAHPELIREYLSLTHVGEYFTIGANPLSLAPGSQAPINSIWSDPATRLDVAISFPGRVLSTTGTAHGTTVRFTDAEQFVRPYGLRATALDHPGPEWTVLGPIVGLLAGVGLAMAWWYLRRQRRPDPTPDVRPTPPSSAEPPATLREDASTPTDTGPDPAPATPTPVIVGGSDAEPNRSITRSAGEPAAWDDDQWAPPQG